MLVFSGACLLRPQPIDWGRDLTEADQESIRDRLPADAARALLPLSEIFYDRIVSRRFNSRASFDDPSLREFFTSVAAYSDYYAGLVDALERAHIQYSRPTFVALTGIEHDPSGSLRLALLFVGENDLPLRWWTASLRRVDEWRWQDGRWWVVPGKL